MTTVTNDSTGRRAPRPGPGSAPAWGSRSSRRSPSGSPARWPRASSRRAGRPGRQSRSGSRSPPWCCSCPRLLALRGRWHLLRTNVGLVTGYGLAAVAGCQLTYFYAVEHLQVGVALLIEYTAPVAVIAWMWLRHGHRPGSADPGRRGRRRARAGAGARPALGRRPQPGRRRAGRWLAMAGAAVYFIVSAERGQRPAADRAGRERAGVGRRGPGARRAGAPASRWRSRPPMSPTAARGSPFWLPLLGLGVVTAALAYVTGIAAGRRLGLAAGLLRGPAGGRSPPCSSPGCCSASCRRRSSSLGGALILAGVVVVKLGERDTASAADTVITPV